MKRIYSVMALFLILFVGTSCEDDYHDIVFFTGAEPIYQVGTCDCLFDETIRHHRWNRWWRRQLFLYEHK